MRAIQQSDFQEGINKARGGLKQWKNDVEEGKLDKPGVATAESESILTMVQLIVTTHGACLLREFFPSVMTLVVLRWPIENYRILNDLQQLSNSTKENFSSHWINIYPPALFFISLQRKAFQTNNRSRWIIYVLRLSDQKYLQVHFRSV